MVMRSKMGRLKLIKYNDAGQHGNAFFGGGHCYAKQDYERHKAYRCRVIYKIFDVKIGYKYLRPKADDRNGPELEDYLIARDSKYHMYKEQNSKDHHGDAGGYRADAVGADLAKVVISLHLYPRPYRYKYFQYPSLFWKSQVQSLPAR